MRGESLTALKDQDLWKPSCFGKLGTVCMDSGEHAFSCLSNCVWSGS